MDNDSAIDDEILALTSIYDCDRNDGDRSVSIRLSVGSAARVLLVILFPDSYPSTDPPLWEITTESVLPGAIYGDVEPFRLSDADLKTVEDRFAGLWEENKGNVVVFEWVEWLKEYVAEKYGAEDQEEVTVDELGEKFSEKHNEEDHAGTKEEEDDKPVAEISASDLAEGVALDRTANISTTLPVPEVFSSEPLVDRKSTFVAHISPIHSPSDFQSFVSHLLTDRRIARATHNISAYRIVKPAEGGRAKADALVVMQDCDDDGETAAGGRLMHLLEVVDARNVGVVVSRWYGGIQLGPDRFKHINTVARNILEAQGYIKGGKGTAGATGSNSTGTDRHAGPHGHKAGKKKR